MERLTTSFKRAELKRLARAAVAASATLENFINSVMDEIGEGNSSGTILVAAAGNGASTQFQLSNGLSPVALQELYSDLDDLREESESELIEEGTATPTDAQILVRMLTLLLPRNEQYSDRSLIQA